MAREVDLRRKAITDDNIQSFVVNKYNSVASKTCLNLSGNRIGERGLRDIVQLLKNNRHLSACVWLNNFQFATLYSVLDEMQGLDLVFQGRLTAEQSPAERAMEKRAMQLMKSEGTVVKLSSMFQDWIGVEATSTEQEITKAVVEFCNGSVLSITKLLQDDGVTDLCEFDGMVFGQLQDRQVLIPIEAKHRVVQKHISNNDPAKPGLEQRLSVFQQFLLRAAQGTTSNNSKLRAQYQLYKRFSDCEVMGAIGGVHFEDTLKAFAKRKGFLCVSADGSRYHVEA